jgi:aminopeptidase N
MVAGVKGGSFVDTGAAPRAAFAHEICHAWTRGTGPGSNFIQEGWATFCEGLVLRHRASAEVEKRFWDVQAERYFRVHDGKYRINDDAMNSGVAYQKGAWIFKMLEGILGEKKFNEVMTRFAAVSQRNPQTVEQFMTITGQAAFLKPWITEQSAPVLSTTTNGNTLSIAQTGPLFDLPLTVEVRTAGSVSRQKVRVSERTTIVKADTDIVSVVLDPNRELLLRR